MKLFTLFQYSFKHYFCKIRENFVTANISRHILVLKCFWYRIIKQEYILITKKWLRKLVYFLLMAKKVVEGKNCFIIILIIFIKIDKESCSAQLLIVNRKSSESWKWLVVFTIWKIVHIKMYLFSTIINLHVIDAKHCNGTLSDFTAKGGGWLFTENYSLWNACAFELDALEYTK